VRCAGHRFESFKWGHYPGDIILWCVRWYLRSPISFAHMAEMAPTSAIAGVLWPRFKLKYRRLRPRGRMQLTPHRRIQMATCWTGLIGTGLIETTRSAGHSAQRLLWALDASEPRTLCRAMAAEAAIT
jgi:hypothetical protein